MSQYATIPFLNPFRFYPDTETPGVHLDDRWAFAQVRPHERGVRYLQKWQRSDTTHLYVESTIAPAALRVIGVDGLVKKTFAWSVVFTATSYAGYKVDFDISDLPEGKYFLTQQVTLASINWNWVSEPLHSKDSWPGTMGITYKNSYNTEGVAFTAGVEFFFRVEAALPPQEMVPKRERTTAVSQTRNVKTLKGTPYRTFQLHVGQAPESNHWVGVAPWAADLLNRIFCLDYISLEGKRFESNTEVDWEMVGHKEYPLVGASIELVEAFNNSGATVATQDGTTILAGVVTAYAIEAAFWGEGTTIPVTDVQEQG